MALCAKMLLQGQTRIIIEYRYLHLTWLQRIYLHCYPVIEYGESHYQFVMFGSTMLSKICGISLINSTSLAKLSHGRWLITLIQYHNEFFKTSFPAHIYAWKVLYTGIYFRNILFIHATCLPLPSLIVELDVCLASHQSRLRGISSIVRGKLYH